MEMTSEIKTMVIPPKFVEHCIGVIAFCLNDHTKNKALPTNRIKAVWNLVAGAPSWNQTYYKFVRLHLEKIGVIDIFDKKQEAGKAWRWSKGENFPAKMADKRTKKKSAGACWKQATNSRRLEGGEEREEGI